MGQNPRERPRKIGKKYGVPKYPKGFLRHATILILLSHGLNISTLQSGVKNNWLLLSLLPK